MRHVSRVSAGEAQTSYAIKVERARISRPRCPGWPRSRTKLPQAFSATPKLDPVRASRSLSEAHFNSVISPYGKLESSDLLLNDTMLASGQRVPLPQLVINVQLNGHGESGFEPYKWHASRNCTDRTAVVKRVNYWSR